MYREVYDYATEKEELIAKGHRFRINNDPEFLIHLYEEQDRNLPE